MGTTETTIRAAGRLLRALLAGVVVALVLGIIGLHTLNTHGVMGNTDHATVPMPADVGAHMSGDVTDTHSVAAGLSAVTARVSEGGAGHGLAHLSMLCGVMFTAVAGALLLVLIARRHIPRRWESLRTASTPVTRWLRARLGTGPPPVWEFSVVRC